MLYLQSVRFGKVFSLDENVVERSREGGEGTVYPSSCVPVGDDLVAKVYHEHKPERGTKLDAMMSSPPAELSRGDNKAPIVAWPVDLLKLEGRQGREKIAGYLMPEVIGTAPHQIYHPVDRRESFPLIRYDYIVGCAASIAEVVSLLHQEGYVIGDINESNFLISSGGEATAIDADSFQVPDPSSGDIYKCEVGTRPYIPPELYGRKLSTVRRREEHDRYGLAVLIFQLLMGRAPMQSRYKGSGSRSNEFVFPYGKPEEGFKPNYVPPKGVKYEILHEPLRELFERCFHVGLELPSERPTPEEWARALRSAEQNLSSCLWNGQHRYSPHLDSLGGFYKQCPWCEHKRDRPDGKDPFPSKFRVGMRRAQKDEPSGFLQADMPGDGEGRWIGMMGTVGLAVGAIGKHVSHLTNSADGGNSTKKRDRSGGGLWQRQQKRRGLWVSLLALAAAIPLVWLAISVTDVQDLSSENLDILGASNEPAGLGYAVQIDADRLNVRSGPSTSRDVVAIVQKGEQFDVLSARSRWQKVRVQSSDGGQREGWIYSGYTSRVSKQEHNTKGEKLIPLKMSLPLSMDVFPSRPRPVHALFILLSFISLASMLINKFITGKYVPNWRNEIIVDKEGRTWLAKRNWPIFISFVAVALVAFEANTLVTKTLICDLTATLSIPLAGFCAYVSILPAILIILLVIAFNLVRGIW